MGYMTREEKEELKKIYNIYSTEELCDMFNVTKKYLSDVRRKLGIGLREVNNQGVKEGFKKCGDCKQILPLDDFYWRNRSDHSKGKYSTCIECSRIKKAIAWHEEIRQKNSNRIEEFKAENKNEEFLCKKCQQSYKLNKFEVFISKNGRLSIKCNDCGSKRTI